MHPYRPPWARQGRHNGFLPVVVAVVQVGITYLASRHQPEAQPLDALAYVLLAGTGLVLLARPRYPQLVLAIVAAAVVIYHALNYANGPIFLSLVIALVGAVLGGSPTAQTSCSSSLRNLARPLRNRVECRRTRYLLPKRHTQPCTPDARRHD